jgi:hypothetical protein
MAVQQYVKPILPKLMPKSANIVRANIRRATKRVCDHAAEELRFLVEAWNHQPQPTVKIEESPNEIKGTTQTEDTAMFMLDGGTSERWALMSSNFQAKTKHRSLRSGAGQGGAVIRGRGAMMRAGIPAQKGIDKREFSKELMDQLAPEFEREIDAVMADAILKGQAVKP